MKKQLGTRGSLDELQRQLAGSMEPQSVEELQRQFAGALEQQAATAKILDVINRSGGDLQPVFQAVLDEAQRLLAADSAGLYRVVGDQLETVALGSGVKVPGLKLGDRIPMGRQTVAGAAGLDRRTVHIPDVKSVPALPQNGPRSRLGVPIVRADVLFGVITVAHVAPRPFTPREIALLETFAGQVGLAIENARLLNETQEGLERQTAIAEILRAISGSPTDVQPVLDAIAENAARFCAAEDATVMLIRGGHLEAAAHFGSVGTHLERPEARVPREVPNDTTSVGGRAILERRVVEVDDILAAAATYPATAVRAREFGFRSIVVAPLLREGTPLGLLVLRRAVTGPFSPRQVDLLRTFADQAVIAMENVRLFNETKEALAQQTAIAEVLQIIGRSAFVLGPVLETLLDRAVKLCDADDGSLALFEGSLVRTVAASASYDGRDHVLGRGAVTPAPGTITARVRVEGRAIQVADLDTDPVYVRGGPSRPLDARSRTGMGVPLLREGAAVGVILLRRNDAPRPFSPEETKLVETFADQAVIAIENVRLFNETKEALEQQTASAEILRVIAGSPTDIRPVLQAIAESAAELCAAEDAAIGLVDGNTWSVWAHHGPVELRPENTAAIDDQFVSGHAMIARGTIRVDDLQSDASRARYPGGSRVSPTTRAIMSTPLLRQGTAVGAIFVRRSEAVPFTDRHAALIEAFASQAVIAIENVRLFNETKEALEQQTAVADVLATISRSVFDLDTVLREVLDRARELCGADHAMVVRRKGSDLALVAYSGESEEYRAAVSEQIASGRGYVLGPGAEQAMRERRPVHLTDIDPETRPQWGEGPTGRVPGFMRRTGSRSRLVVPLIRDDTVLGLLILARSDPRGFNDRLISLVRTFADQAAIAIENVRLFNETKEALDQQTATADVLQVISRSAFDLQSVLDTLAENAVKLCEADHCDVVHWDGRVYRDTAHYGVAPEGYRELVERTEYKPDRGTLIGRTVLERQPVHIVDVLQDADYRFSDAQKLGGFRSMLGMPIMRDEFPIGAISVWRTQVRPFSDKQIQLLRTFADQAAIAMENVRLFNETKESLEQQTASADVLKVISTSKFDLQPVFDAVVRHAVALCGADNASIVFWSDTGAYRYLASAGDFPDAAEFAASWDSFKLRPDRGTLSGRLLLERRSVQIEDIDADPEYEHATKKAAGTKTHLAVPLLRDGEPIGMIIARRFRVRLFTDKQVQLLETFAAQAVIAIENVRLFNETKESLDRQTATSEVLRSISGSAFEIRPVFETILDQSLRLCDAEDALVVRAEDDGIRVAAHRGPVDIDLDRLYPMTRGLIAARAVIDGTTVEVTDMLAEPAEFPESYQLATAYGFRSTLATPLRRQGEAVGAILIRRRDVRPFTPEQVRLLETFADQAVIAIENVRLFNETKEALERQTAVAGILRSISESPTDVQPVLDTIAESAARFCGAEDATLLMVDGEMLRTRAHHGPVPLRTQLSREFPLTRGTVTGRSILERRTVHVPDLTAESDDEYPIGKEQARRMGHRTTLATPLIREGVAIGAILLRRMEVRPFTEHQLELVRTFADQAVISIENVRLFNETTEALERQTAISEILRVISQSPTDIQPVLDAIAQNAARYCQAEDAVVMLPDGDVLRAVAHFGPHRLVPDDPSPRSFTYPMDRGSLNGTAFLEGRVIHTPDILAESDRYPVGAASMRETGVRAGLVAPLLREGTAIGTIALRRTEARPFTDKQIALLQTFAAQAVIAIENVRLFNQTKQSLDRQTAIAEVLATISRSVFDLNAILTTVIQNAVKLCGAKGGLIFRRHGEDYRLEAMYGGHPAFIEYFKERVLHPGRQAVTMRAVTVGEPVQIADVEADPDYEHTAVREFEPFRTVLGIPLLHQGKPIGAMSLWRNEVREFSTAEIELVKTFADQAAIAIENVRLFNETKEALAQQTATAEVLKAISRTTFDLQPILDTLTARARQLCGADSASIRLREADGYKVVADEGIHRTFEEGHVIRPDPSSLTGRVVLARRAVEIPDLRSDPMYDPARLTPGSTTRTMLGVPLLRDGDVIGVMLVRRDEVRSFSGREVELVQTFADQAVIAIENVRLFSEIQDKSRQLEIASRHKSEFLANMSHELRTPLNAIIGFTDVMLEEMFGPLNEKQREYLEDVRNSGNHLLTLINDILDLSKIEAGRVELELGDFSFPAALDNALTLVRERATRHGITLAAEVAPDLGTISADERKVKQVLVNLLANAVKFTPDGGWVSVTAKRANGAVEVAVRDTGIGVAAEDQERIFDEFQQVGRDPDKAREGTGLGLTLAKRFVELHGGRIWVESEVGKGSTFTFSIPVRQTALAGAKG